MLVIGMREFRANQGKYLDMVKNGIELVLKSGVPPAFDSVDFQFPQNTINPVLHPLR